ncbi:MAG TPA: helix-turn-helix transcriptional regulator [Gaiellaceae bacterium]|nr:helix-turn-helix transcriptional regulator [Gaiellaceae bacterium]
MLESRDLPATRGATASAIGERVRRLRIARGLTQAEVARDRVTKEYVSQIERGRARPTARTLEWLAERLGVERAYLETGASLEEAERAAGLVVRAEAAISANRFEEALDVLDGLADSLAGKNPELELRALLAESSARTALGELDVALALLDRARDLAERPDFGDLDRARVLFHIGRCRYKVSSIGSAVALFGEALDLVRRSELSDDRLVASILRWRSRCYRRQRDWWAASRDVEQALELMVALGDRRGMAHTYFQASIIAERNGQWILARSHAERAKALYEEQDDRANVGRLLNNLGGLTFLLGNSDEAVRLLKESFSIAIELGGDAEAAHAVSSLAQVHLRTGELARAEEQARHALRLLDGRVDYLDEIGDTQLVLGRALLGQDRLDEAEAAFAEAESAFEQLSSASHTAAAWTAQAELAVRRGDRDRALALYQRATNALQDVRF